MSNLEFLLYINPCYSFPIGHGWIVSNTNGTFSKLAWHGGGLLGTTTMVTIFPEQEIVGVVLVNKGGVSELQDIVFHVAENIYHLV